MLRYYAPVTMARKVIGSREVAGTTVHPGDQMLLTFPAACHDPAAFEEPEKFDIYRKKNRHVAFGLGVHRCVGSNLARLELTVALQEWLRAFPNYSLDTSQETTWANGQVRGPRNIHSTSAYQTRQAGNVAREQIGEEQKLAKTLNAAVVVTTIDQLLMVLSGTREDHHLSFFNLAHSCVVIDEADFYDEFTQLNLTVLFAALQALEVPVLVMSATLPDSSVSFYGGTERSIFEDHSQKDRIRCKLRLLNNPVHQPEQLREQFQRAKTQPMIVYANTVDRAFAYFEWFQQNPIVPKDRQVLYHSRFRESHKVDKEESVISLLGSRQWENAKEPEPCVIILTQIGELSVNISANLMVSDLCPIDRLTQRIGRLARFSEQPGELIVVEPATEDLKFYPAPYGTYRNSQWEASYALEETRKRIRSGDYSSKSLVDLVNDVYPEQPPTNGDAGSNRLKFQELVASNWLLLPGKENTISEENDDGYADWKTRNIPPQTKVYVEPDKHPKWNSGVFQSWSEFQGFDIEHSISIPFHGFYQKLKNNGAIDNREAYVGSRQEPVSIPVIARQLYSIETGLVWRDCAQFDFPGSGVL